MPLPGHELGGVRPWAGQAGRPDDLVRRGDDKGGLDSPAIGRARQARPVFEAGDPDLPGAEEEAFMSSEFWWPGKYETMGDYYNDVTKKAVTQFSVEQSSVDFLTNGDRKLLRELYESGKISRPFVVQVIDKGVLGVPTESEEWGIQEFGLIRDDLVVAGQTGTIENNIFGTIAKVSVVDKTRETFWHEIGHVAHRDFVQETSSGHFEFLQTGDMFDWFSEEMVRRANSK